MLGAGAIRNFEEVEQALRARGYLDRVLKAAWPVVAPDRLVRSLDRIASRRSRPAADGILERAGAEAARAARRRLVGRRHPAARRSARTARCAAAHVYGHVIVDEAQDLTPMQLRMVARRARGRRIDDSRRRRPGNRRESATRAGTTCCRICRTATRPMSRSCATPTGCRARSWSWRCRCSTRSRPTSRRRSPTAPAPRRRVLHLAPEEHLLAEAFDRPPATAPDGLLAVIVPEELLDRVPGGDLWDGVPVLTPRQAKGLEFDHVVVVEPALIAALGASSTSP